MKQKNKLGIIVDSSSGMLERDIKNKKNFYFLPIIIYFNDKEYKSGIDIDNNFLYKNVKKNSKIKTAAVNTEQIKKIFNEALEENENIIYISISRHLSSTNSNAKLAAKELNMEDRISVFNSNFITPWFQITIPIIEKILENDNIIDKKNVVLDLLNDVNQNMEAFLIPDTLDFLYSGGRITKTQYLAGNLLKITPIIVFKNGNIAEEDVIRTRTLKKSYIKSIEEVLKLKNKYESEGKFIKIGIANINSDDNFNLLVKLLEKKNIHRQDYLIVDLSCEIISHIGPHAVGIGIFVCEKNNYFKDIKL